MSKKGSCCPQDAHEFLAEDPNYVPKGEMVKFDDVEAYIVGGGSVCMIFIHDIFGLPTGMNKLICDTLVERIPNLIVIAPDFFPGEKVFGNDPLLQRGPALMSSHMFGMVWKLISCQLLPYLTKYNWENSAESIFNKVTLHMKSTHNIEKFILMGICWGSYIAFRALSDAKDVNNIIGMDVKCLFL
jgi:dienelactone hydrolase